jgi:hypothetical protein
VEYAQKQKRKITKKEKGQEECNIRKNKLRSAVLEVKERNVQNIMREKHRRIAEKKEKVSKCRSK